MKSIILHETQDGGDLLISIENGIQAGDYLPTAVYCALFGGNVEENTREQYIRFEQNRGYFGNCFLRKKYNSETERTIFNAVNVVLEYESIKRAIRTDLRKLQPFPIKDIVNIEIEARNLGTKILFVDTEKE